MVGVLQQAYRDIVVATGTVVFERLSKCWDGAAMEH